MAAWDTGPFDNDDAVDWLEELIDSSDISILSATLDVIGDVGEDFLESADCCNAIAAAEIVAALLGQAGAGLPAKAKAWIKKYKKLDAAPLLPTAQAVVQRIRKKSELKDQWEESEDPDKWYAAIDDLATRLEAA